MLLLFPLRLLDALLSVPLEAEESACHTMIAITLAISTVPSRESRRARLRLERRSGLLWRLLVDSGDLFSCVCSLDIIVSFLLST